MRASDFEEFDLILAMDGANLQALRRMAPDEEGAAKVALLREFDPAGAGSSSDLDVPDPYYGPGDGFERVLELVQGACAGLLDQIGSGLIPSGSQ